MLDSVLARLRQAVFATPRRRVWIGSRLARSPASRKALAIHKTVSDRVLQSGRAYFLRTLRAIHPLSASIVRSAASTALAHLGAAAQVEKPARHSRPRWPP